MQARQSMQLQTASSPEPVAYFDCLPDGQFAILRGPDLAPVELPLTRRERAAYVALTREAYRTFTKAELAQIAGCRSIRELESAICRLRHKILTAGGPAAPRLVWGVGYRLLHP